MRTRTGPLAFSNILQARLLREISPAGQQRLTVSPVDVQPNIFLKFILAPPQPGTQAPAKVEGECQVWEKRLNYVHRVAVGLFQSSRGQSPLIFYRCTVIHFVCASPVAHVAR